MIRSERGSALLTVIIALSLAVILSGAVVLNTVHALHSSSHEELLKRAQAAADAAIDQARFDFDRVDLTGALNIDPLAPGNVTQQNCVIASAGNTLGIAALATGDAWCPSRSDTSGNANWSYRVSALARVDNGVCGDSSLLSLDRKIVAVGRAGSVVRRVNAVLRAPVSLFSGAAVQSGATSTAMTMAGTAKVTGNVAANGSITVTTGTPVIVGKASAGYGASITGVTPTLGSGLACQRFALPPVDQGTAATVNNNGTWSSNCYDTTTLVTTVCGATVLGVTTTTGGVDWNAASRSLRIWGNARLYLTGSTYSFCGLKLEGNGMLIVPNNNAGVRIFIDDPANCPAQPATGASKGQVTSDGLSRIVNCHLQTAPETLQLYAVGSATTATTQTFAGATPLSAALTATLCGLNLPAVGTPMIVYAPRSTLSMSGNAAISGIVAANVVNMSGAASVTSINSVVNLNELGSRPVLPLYTPQRYVSCTPADFAALPATNPASGC